MSNGVFKCIIFKAPNPPEPTPPKPTPAEDTASDISYIIMGTALIMTLFTLFYCLCSKSNDKKLKIDSRTYSQDEPL
jgi:hypothetical protein